MVGLSLFADQAVAEVFYPHSGAARDDVVIACICYHTCDESVCLAHL
jgi:hypothetical protein